MSISKCKVFIKCTLQEDSAGSYSANSFANPENHDNKPEIIFNYFGIWKWWLKKVLLVIIIAKSDYFQFQILKKKKATAKLFLNILAIELDSGR